MLGMMHSSSAWWLYDVCRAFLPEGKGMLVVQLWSEEGNANTL